MSDWFDQLKQTIAPFGKAMVNQMAPEMAQGFINNLFHQWEIDKNKVQSDVLNDRSLLERVTPEQEARLRSVYELLGNLARGKLLGLQAVERCCEGKLGQFGHRKS